MSFRVKVRVEEATSATQFFIFSKERLSSKARYLARAFGGSFIEARTITYSERSDSSKLLIEVQGDTKTHMFELSWDKVSSVSRFFKKALPRQLSRGHGWNDEHYRLVSRAFQRL
jgi:hypothetical protein